MKKQNKDALEALARRDAWQPPKVNRKVLCHTCSLRDGCIDRKYFERDHCSEYREDPQLKLFP